MYKMICEDCEKVFEAVGASHRCPACHKRRLSENAKRRGLNKIGTAAYTKKVRERNG